MNFCALLMDNKTVTIQEVKVNGRLYEARIAYPADKAFENI